MIDLDDFKKYNQYYSYAQGDWLLKEIAELLQTYLISEHTIMYRLNSARFLVVITHASELSAYTLAERLRMAIYAAAYAFEAGIQHRMTASVAVYVPASRELAAFPEIEAKLCSAIKNAKQTGKNRTIVFD